MGYRTKKEVLSSIARRVRGDRVIYDAYVGYDSITKKQRRFQNKDIGKLKQDIEKFYSTIKNHGDFGVILKPYEAVDARKAYDMLRESHCNLTLESIVTEYLYAKKTPAGTKELGDAFDEYFTTFSKDQAMHKKAVGTRVGRFVEIFGRNVPLASVTAKDVSAWLEEKYGHSPKSYNNYLSYIKTFFNWCTKPEQGYIHENPLSGLSLKSIAYKEPEYLHAEAARKLFTLLEANKDEHPEYIIYAALSFFCGIRREEILRMALMPDAANVNLEDETIRISKPKGWTKGITPRAFHIMDCARAWLSLVPYEESVKLINERTTKQIYDLAEKNGITIPHNAGRHTFITMHVALNGDPAKTEAMAGTSKQMRVSSYCGLASHKEGEEYFSIFPTASSPQRR